MRLFLAIAAAMLASVAARAQTIVINPRPPAPPISARAQRVTMSLTIISAMPTGAGTSELTAGFTAANQSLYSVVDHECDVLAPLLHADCRLVQMTTNGNANERANFGNPPGNPVISVTANATFELDTKPVAGR